MCESRLKVQFYHFSVRAPFKNGIYFSEQSFPSRRLFCMCPLEEFLHLPLKLEKSGICWSQDKEEICYCSEKLWVFYIT